MLKLLRVMFLASFVFTVLTACGEESPQTKDAPVTKAPVAAAKFKGAKFAPSQPDMNYQAGWAITVDRPRRILIKPCNQGMNPAKIMEVCIEQLDAIGKASTFKALECREGDERDNKWDMLVTPVTCDGYVDTPKLATNASVVFHKVGEEWKARIAKYSREGMIHR